MTISSYAKERFVYVDEAGVDNTIDYEYGYCHRSERFPSLKRGHKSERVSMIGGWWCGTIIAPMVFCGYCHISLWMGGTVFSRAIITRSNSHY